MLIVHIQFQLIYFCGNKNLVDAANIAALAALLTFRRPECSLGGEDGQEVIVHPPEISEPLPLMVHQLPIAITFGFFSNESILVLDPTHNEEAVMGGRMTTTVNANGDICAIQKAGGEGVPQRVIMQCLQLATAKASGITKQIKAVDLVVKTERKNGMKHDSIIASIVCSTLEFHYKSMEVEVYNTERALQKIKRHAPTGVNVKEKQHQSIGK
ncbi:hypothetical protein CRYUN_Cryun25bG0058300 [Craigia yunnanensis]